MLVTLGYNSRRLRAVHRRNVLYCVYIVQVQITSLNPIYPEPTGLYPEPEFHNYR